MKHKEMTKNEQVVATIDHHLHGHGQVILEEAQRAGLELALACALVDHESMGGQNIFGQDHGPQPDVPPYCHHPVTKERVRKLIDSPFMNGVGLTQLTWFEFVNEAEAMGGAHLPRYQCRVGFRLLKSYLDRYPYEEALGAYNAGEGNRGLGVRNGYAAKVAERHQVWKERLGGGASELGVDGRESTNFDRGVEYLEPAIGRAPYWFWPPSLDIVPDGPGAYAVNLPPPDINLVIREGLFCQAVINLIRRANRKKVPTAGHESYDGGTLANQIFYSDFIEPFSRWAVYPRGTLIGRYFSWERVARGDQGHVGVLLEEQNLNEQKDGLLLHSHPAVGGLNTTRLGASHAGWYYEYAVRPEDWINHGLSGF